MRNVITLRLLASAFVALATAVTGGVGVAADSAGDHTVPDRGDPRLPEGVYHTPELTRDQLVATGVAAGFAEADVEAFLEGDGFGQTAVYGLKIASGGWTVLITYDGVDLGPGWRATYEVVDDDTVVATERGLEVTFTYQLDGQQLTLDMVDCPCDLGGQIAQTLIHETAPFALESPAGSEGTAASPASYTSTSFVVPFEVVLPEWVAPQPSAELPNFVTWEGAEVDRGIRFLVPVNVYAPGEESPAPVPEDYLAFLLAQSEHGAVFDDVVETIIDGRPATVLTATTDVGGLDGSIGCQEDGLFAADCFGVQPDLILRMAVIDTEDGPPLLIWVRDIRGADNRELEYESFEAMLQSLRFGPGAPPATGVAQGVTAAVIDGVWTMTLTRDELANSPLLYDQGELNNQNWGDFTFVFDSGRWVETQHNAEAVWAMTGTYAVDGDILTLDRDNGEHFVMRWRIDGDTLVLERDDSLGEVPTPFVINPWSRQS